MTSIRWYIHVDLSQLIITYPGSESSWERKFLVLSLPGPKVLRSESSCYRSSIIVTRNNLPGLSYILRLVNWRLNMMQMCCKLMKSMICYKCCIAAHFVLWNSNDPKITNLCYDLVSYWYIIYLWVMQVSGYLHGHMG